MPRLTKPDIPLREKLVAGAAALTLAYTAWGFGGVIAWSLHWMLAGCLCTFVFALVPMPVRWDRRAAAGDSARSTESSRLRAALLPFGRLLRTPAVYPAAAFLAYLAISAYNPAYVIASDQRGWWLEAITPPLASWLPTSVQAPYEPMNVWRIFNMHLAAFSLALGAQVALASRRSVVFVLWSFLVSLSIMAAVAIYQKYAAVDTVLWTYASENANFWGSFFYRNQGVAFLNWGIVVAGVLYFYHAHRSRERARSGGPHFLAFCSLGLIALSVALALSRGGILFAAILVLFFLLFVLIDFSLSTLHVPLPTLVPVSLIIVGLMAAGLFQVHRSIDYAAIEERFGNIEDSLKNADRDARVISSRLTWEMAQENLPTGWGAGSFRYVFPMYQQRIPEFFHHYFHRSKQEWVGRRFFRYAHNDLLQFLAEYGVAGCALLLLTIAAFLLRLARGFVRFPLRSLFLLLGLAAAFSHAFLDFIFHSPAYWIALIAGLALVAQLTDLETKRS